MTDAIKSPSKVVASLPQTQEYTLRAMARNYADGNLWDKLDREACSKAADEIKALRAALTAKAPVGEPFGYVIEVFGQNLFFTAKYHDAARFYEKGGAKKIAVYTHQPALVGEPVKIIPRRPLIDDEPDGYLESDFDYIRNNVEACVAFLDGRTHPPVAVGADEIARIIRCTVYRDDRTVTGLNGETDAAAAILTLLSGEKK